MTANNFDDRNHRIESATAAFQKGLYHLFLIMKRTEADTYGRVIRIYQCLFQICLSQLLLDSNFLLNKKLRHLSSRMKSLCSEPKNPTRSDLDPACLVTHSVFEKPRWTGFPAGHPLYTVSKLALQLYGRVVDARHNLLYRPFLLDGLFWEDCTLINLVGSVPPPEEIEHLYQQFVSAVWEWGRVETESRIARYFMQTIFVPYKDKTGQRPSETLLLSYTRMLNPDNPTLIREIRDYRNDLLRLRTNRLYREITLLPEWQVGEI